LTDRNDLRPGAPFSLPNRQPTSALRDFGGSCSTRNVRTHDRSELVQVDRVVRAHISQPDLEDLLASLKVWRSDVKYSVQAPRSKKSRILRIDKRRQCEVEQAAGKGELTRLSGRFVAATTTTPLKDSTPSISLSRLVRTPSPTPELPESPPERDSPSESISSFSDDGTVSVSRPENSEKPLVTRTHEKDD
jgi:hypothetical protein